MVKSDSLYWVDLRKRLFKSDINFKRTTGLIVLCFSIFVGLWASRLDQAFSWLLLPSLVLALVTWRKKNIFWLLMLIVLGISIGVWRGSMAWQDYAQYDEFLGQKTKLIVTAKTDATYNDYKQLEFEAGDISVRDKELMLPGKITVSGFGELAVNRGEVFLIEGKLFKTRGGKVARMSYADIEKIGESNNRIDKIRQQFVAGMYNALPDPAASFALGILIGQRTTLPDYVNDDFRATGLTHIVAVSGYNLTILVLFARRAFGRFSKYQSTLLASLMISVLC